MALAWLALYTAALLVVSSSASYCCLGSTDLQNKCGACNERAPKENACNQGNYACTKCGGHWCEGQSSGTEDQNLAVRQRRERPDGGGRKLSWVTGTYVTGYWDCCKPSCSWPGKGSVEAPVKSCSASTPGLVVGADVKSVCDGGDAAACTQQQPWYNAKEKRSYGFAAAAVSGKHGLKGDSNCGQCYALKFTDQIHSNGNWGGSHPALVDHIMFIQVTNIGYDVLGEHSFDLQIPSAGQGAFTAGCAKQFPRKSSGDFDCDNNYGGCDKIGGCNRLPRVLQRGCRWRFNIFKWLRDGGQSNNPYVRFARIKCPKRLTDISGSVPLDDNDYPALK